MSVYNGKLQKALEAPDRPRHEKKDLQQAAGLSSTMIAKLSNHEKVSMDVLLKICETLNVGFGDIMEAVPDDK